MTSTDGLFRSFRVGSMELANWIVMPLIMHSFAPTRTPGPAHPAYYRLRAAGVVGLLDRSASSNVGEVT